MVLNLNSGILVQIPAHRKAGRTNASTPWSPIANEIRWNPFRNFPDIFPNGVLRAIITMRCYVGDFERSPRRSSSATMILWAESASSA